jgi:hypothetical protein
LEFIDTAASNYFLEKFGCDPSQFFLTTTPMGSGVTDDNPNGTASWTANNGTESRMWLVAFEIVAPEQEANAHYVTALSMTMLAANTTGRRMANTTCDLQQPMLDQTVELDCDSLIYEEPEIKAVTATMTTVSVTETTVTFTTSTSSSSSTDTTATTRSTNGSPIPLGASTVTQESTASGYLVVIVVLGAACVIACPFPLLALCRYRRRLRELPVKPARKKHEPEEIMIDILTDDEGELDQVERLEKAADAKVGAHLLVVRDIGAASDGKIAIVKKVDTSDDTVLCHVPSLGKDEWFSARMLAKKPLEGASDLQRGVSRLLPVAGLPRRARRPPPAPGDLDLPPEVPRTPRRLGSTSPRQDLSDHDARTSRSLSSPRTPGRLGTPRLASPRQDHDTLGVMRTDGRALASPRTPRRPTSTSSTTDLSDQYALGVMRTSPRALASPRTPSRLGTPRSASRQDLFWDPDVELGVRPTGSAALASPRTPRRPATPRSLLALGN